MGFSLPLVRVEGKPYSMRRDLTLTAQRFASAAPLDPEARDQIARAAEQRYGLGPCLYFYAGFACPDFGDIVLIYEPSIAGGVGGNASSFDTGGMFDDRIHGHGLPDDAARGTHVANDLCDLTDWESRAIAWVSTYFNGRGEYLEGRRPHTDDASGRLHDTRNTRRAWTYEVRLHQQHDLFDGLVCAVVRQDFWFDVLREADRVPHHKQRLLALFGSGQIQMVPSSDEPCDAAPHHITVFANNQGGPP